MEDDPNWVYNDLAPWARGTVLSQVGQGFDFYISDYSGSLAEGLDTALSNGLGVNFAGQLLPTEV